MSENKLLVAFDLSDQCVRAAIGRAHEEQIEILAIEQMPTNFKCLKSNRVCSMTTMPLN